MTYNESGTNVYIHDVTHDSFGKTYSSCIYIHDVTQWVTSRINEPRDAWMSHVTYERVTSYIHMHDVEWVLHTCMNESCDIWMSRVSYKRVCTHMSESYPTDPQHTATQWVTSRMNGSVTWLVQTRLYETWLIYMWHDSFMNKMTHSYVTWLVYMWHDSCKLACMRHDSFICDTTRSYIKWLNHMWHDLFICDMTRLYVTWLVYMWRDSFICDMTRAHSLIRNMPHCNTLRHTYEWVISYRSCHIYKWVMPHI